MSSPPQRYLRRSQRCCRSLAEPITEPPPIATSTTLDIPAALALRQASSDLFWDMLDSDIASFSKKHRSAAPFFQRRLHLFHDAIVPARFVVTTIFSAYRPRPLTPERRSSNALRNARAAFWRTRVTLCPASFVSKVGIFSSFFFLFLFLCLFLSSLTCLLVGR